MTSFEIYLRRNSKRFGEYLDTFPAWPTPERVESDAASEPWGRRQALPRCA